MLEVAKCLQWVGVDEKLRPSRISLDNPCPRDWSGACFDPRSMADRSRIDALEARTAQFAIDIVLLVRHARTQPELRPACEQLNASAGSVAANHRAAGRSRSTKEFAAKLQIVHEEADESAHWLSQLKATSRDAAINVRIEKALREAIELRNIFGRARSTTRARYFAEKT